MTAEREYATADDLVTDATVDVKLPILGKWAKVRLLTTPEITELSFLPDLVGFTKLAQQLVSDEMDQIDSGKFLVEQVRYNATVAHASVVKGEIGPPTLCEDCGLKHPESMWSLKQAERLQHEDLRVIADAAVGVQALARVRPFSREQTQNGSRTPATSGA